MAMSLWLRVRGSQSALVKTGRWSTVLASSFLFSNFALSLSLSLSLCSAYGFFYSRIKSSICSSNLIPYASVHVYLPFEISVPFIP